MDRPTSVLLPFVAFFLRQTSDDAPFPTATLAQVATALGDLGYAFVPRKEGATDGKLTHDGATVDAWIDAPSPRLKDDPPPPVRSLHLTIELAFPREIPLDLKATNGWSGVSSASFLIVPHLGKTATVREWIDLSQSPKLGDVRSRLDRFWRDTRAYAQAHGSRFVAAREPDRTKVVFSDNDVLRVADEVSLDRLIAAWSLYPRHGSGGSTAGWIIPAQVGDVDVILWQDVRGDIPPGQSFTLDGDVDLPPGFDVERWVRANGRRFSWAIATEGDTHEIRPVQTVDLRRGISLGDLRRRILSFANDVAALRRSLGAK